MGLELGLKMTCSQNFNKIAQYYNEKENSRFEVGGKGKTGWSLLLEKM